MDVKRPFSSSRGHTGRAHLQLLLWSGADVMRESEGKLRVGHWFERDPLTIPRLRKVIFEIERETFGEGHGPDRPDAQVTT